MHFEHRRKILASVIVPGLLSLVLLVAVLRGSLNEWAIESWTMDHRTLVSALKNRIDSEIGEAKSLIRFAANSGEFSALPQRSKIDLSINGLPEHLEPGKRRMLEQLRSQGRFSVLFVLTPEGDHYMSHPFQVQRSLKKYNLSDRAYFKKAVQTRELVVSDSFIGADGVPAVAIDLPVLDERGEIVLHLGGVMYLAHLTRVLAPSAIAPFDQAALVDRQGNRVADSDPERLVKGPVEPLSSHPRFVNPGSGGGAASGDKHEVEIIRSTTAAGARWLDFETDVESGWHLFLFRNLDQLETAIAPQIRKVAYLAAGILLMPMLVGLFMALRYSRRWQVADAALAEANVSLEKRIHERTADLTKSEARHRTLFESTSDAILILDEDGVLDCNLATLRIFGASHRDEILAKHPAVLSPERQPDGEESLTAANRKIGEALTMGANEFDWLHRRLDTGETFVARVVLSRMELDGKQVIQGSVRDITERRKAERDLRESEALFRAVSESANDAIVTADGTGKIIKWNKGAESIFGYQEAEVTGQSLTLLMPQRFRAQHTEGMNRVSSGHAPRVMGKPVEVTGRRMDGSEFPLELSLAQWKIGENRFYTGVIRDITGRKKIEKQLEDRKTHLEDLVAQRTTELTGALEAAKLADQTKDAFLANMSHELRTPLNAVIGMANLARTLSTEPKQCDYLDKIAASGKHLNRIINDLLDLSKITAGHMDFETIHFSLQALILRCNSVMAHRAAGKGLELVETIADTVPDVLIGDPVRIEQILLNLVGNAIKFTPSGRIEVRVGLSHRNENRVCLSIEVEDTGIGMNEDELAKLFRPFSQADVSVSRRFGGTGLGLTISRRLAEMMDGSVSVTSREGSGTTFHVKLCLDVGDAAKLSDTTPAIAEALPERYRDARVLVADDQPLNREIVEALLTAVGITPHMVTNGQEVLDVLDKAGAEAFDLVLMDIQMPVMDGLTATRGLRVRAGFQKLPVIAMTAHTMAHERDISTAAGMNDHIGKPFDNAGFYRTLARWIDRSKQQFASGPVTAETQTGQQTETSLDLESLIGIDVGEALARFGGKRERYRHWLADFVATAAQIPHQVQDEISAARTDKAVEIIHAFKGRVGMLGMTGLHTRVAELEYALREGMPAGELQSGLQSAIEDTREEVMRVLGGRSRAANKQALERVAWSDVFSVGVTEMDGQHKKLIVMINQLADCHDSQPGGISVTFNEVLSAMFDYTQYHFNAEEDYLKKIGYPGLSTHSGEHQAFVEKMAAYNMAACSAAPDTPAVHRYLKEWLLEHILKSDMQYRYFVENSAGAAK